ncbi:MAG: carboxypeptidase-like regulatory domain-containing protein [Flavobacteriales bacterium]
MRLFVLMMNLRQSISLATFFIMCWMFVGKSFAQQVEGLILDQNHQAISQAHILNLTQSIGAVSDSSGYFNIKAKHGDLVVYSALAYEKDSVNIDSEKHFNELNIIKLVDKNIKLEHVVLVGHTFSMIDTSKRDLEPIEMSLPFPNRHIRKPALDRRAAYLKPKLSIGTLISSLNGSYQNLERLQSVHQEQVDIERMRTEIEDSLFVDMGIVEADIYLFLDFVFHRNSHQFRRHLRTANVFEKLNFLKSKRNAFLKTKS